VSGIPVLTAGHVLRAVSPSRAVDAVRKAFVEHAAGRWTMPPKVYVTNYPAGDFRAMPALGGGFALLKWINSFPGNPALGLPTVSGVVLLSDAESGQLRAVIDAASVTALRTGAAAVLAAEVLGRPDAAAAVVIGAGVNGRAAARTFVDRGREVAMWDVDEARAAEAARELGCDVAPSLGEALAADIVVTVTPGHEALIGDDTLGPGQHVSLMGADGPGKAEATDGALLEGRLFCDDWEQASHGGELAHAVEAGLIDEGQVTAIGEVLAGRAAGRSAAEEITLFDSTGLAIQDLAVALAAYEAADDLDDVQRLEL
jgi:ornithine cyclodeaminase/alanine dehydrogenase-like protein (mu-crystallin family)